MDSIKLIYILLVISYCYAIPLQSITSTTTEKATELITKSATLKSNNGLSSTQSPLIKTTINQLTSNKPSVRVSVRSASELNSPEALYQMATSLLMKEKRNWLQTEKWLIDNVYRLKNELGDVKRELNEQKKLNSVLNNQKNNPQFLNHVQVSSNNEQTRLNFIHDLSSLKSDHNSINQQQQQLIEITKINQQKILNQTDLLKQLLTMIKEKFKSVTAINQAIVPLQQITDSTNGNRNQSVSSKLIYLI